MSGRDFANLSLEAARRELTLQLRSAHFDTPELDARLLVGAATQLDLTGLTSAAQRPLQDDEFKPPHGAGAAATEARTGRSHSR